MPDNRHDEFSYMSSHRRHLEQEKKKKEDEEKIHAQVNTPPAKPPITSHPPYGKPYKTDKKIPNARKRQSIVHKKAQVKQQQINRDNINAQERARKMQEETARKLQAETFARKKAQAQKQQRATRIEQQRKIASEKRKINSARREMQLGYYKAMISAYVARLIAMIIVGVLIFTVSFVAFRISLSISNSPSQENYTYIINGEKRKLDSKIALKNGTLYLCGDDIASMCNLTVAGDEYEIKYISPDNGNETASFRINTRSAYVNKNEIRLSSETFKEDERLYIPLEFFENYMQGVKIVHNENERTVTVSRIVINESDIAVLGAKAEYADITYKLKNSQAILSLNENALSADDTVYKYDIDITPFEEYINPASIFEYVKIINRTNPAEGTFRYNDLTVTSNQSVRNEVPVELRLCAAKALEAMLMEAKKNDVTRYAVFRGYVTMEDLLQAADDDKKHISKYGQPQYDENLLGLTAEVYFGDREESYGKSEVFEWFEENAHRFGFIVRYPKEKQTSTGVEFRPWTLRFVGRYSATRIVEENLSLEEYVAKYNLNR